MGRRPGRFEPGRAGQHLGEQGAHLGAGQVSAEAEVRSVPEHQVRVGLAADVEPPGIGEDELRELALAAPGAVRALDGAGVKTVIVRAPRLVNIVPA